jgi:DNA-binding NarL/FixJ family response regulator
MQLNPIESPVRVLIVDDHPVVRAGLTTLLRKEASLRVVGSAHNSDEALSIIKRTEIDLMLLDLRMPKVNGIDLLRMIQKLPHPPAVVILSSYKYEEEIYQAFSAGARGYLSKNASRAEIVKAIAAVSTGQLSFPSDIMEYITRHDSGGRLSGREIEILEMVAKGLTNKEIAQVLQLSQFTVRNHLNHICSKLEVADRTEAATAALRSGIIHLSD